MTQVENAGYGPLNLVNSFAQSSFHQTRIKKYFHSELMRFSTVCRKIQSKLITLANHNSRKQGNDANPNSK